MIYERWLKKNKICPFCELKREEIVKGNKYAVLILGRAPYCKDHLLVTPRRHRLTLNELSAAERKGVDDLRNWGMKKLHKKYRNVTVLYREGNLSEVGKSVEHLHYHLIPELQIGAINGAWKKRRFFSEKKYLEKTQRFKENFIKRK